MKIFITFLSNKYGTKKIAIKIKICIFKTIFTDKADPFHTEKETIEALLSQWTEEEIPESELSIVKPGEDVPCFNSIVIEETSQLFEPVTAVPVKADLPQDNAIIVELGADPAQVKPQIDTNVSDIVMMDGHVADHGRAPKSGDYLPVEGGYIVVHENAAQGDT